MVLRRQVLFISILHLLHLYTLDELVISTYPDDNMLAKWQELGHQVSLIREIAEKVFGELGTSVSYKVGTMIEIPRAALVADEVSVIFQHYYIYIYI